MHDFAHQIGQIESALELRVETIPREAFEGYLVGEAIPIYGEAWIPPVTDELSYLTALHEFGHCADPVQVDWYTGNDCNMVEAEIAAWRFTFQHAIEISFAGFEAAAQSFRGYLDWEDKDTCSFRDDVLLRFADLPIVQRFLREHHDTLYAPRVKGKINYFIPRRDR